MSQPDLARNGRADGLLGVHPDAVVLVLRAAVPFLLAWLWMRLLGLTGALDAPLRLSGPLGRLKSRIWRF